MASWEIPELAMEAAGKLLQLEDFPASHEADCWVCRFRQAQARWNFEIQRGPSSWVQRLKISWLRRTIDFCRCPWLLLIEIHDFPDSNGLVWGKEHYRQQYFLQMLGVSCWCMFPSTIFNQFGELTEPTFLFHGIILRVPAYPNSHYHLFVFYFWTIAFFSVSYAFWCFAGCDCVTVPQMRYGFSCG